MAPTNRYDIYLAIDDERSHQYKKWSPAFDDKDWSIADWLLFIERYVQRAKDQVGRFDPLNSWQDEVMDTVRKIAALAVAMMENKGLVARGELDK